MLDTKIPRLLRSLTIAAVAVAIASCAAISPPGKDYKGLSFNDLPAKSLSKTNQAYPPLQKSPAQLLDVVQISSDQALVSMLSDQANVWCAANGGELLSLEDNQELRQKAFEILAVEYYPLTSSRYFASVCRIADKKFAYFSFQKSGFYDPWASGYAREAALRGTWYTVWATDAEIESGYAKRWDQEMQRRNALTKAK